jgi:four helix bundle protein
MLGEKHNPLKEKSFALAIRIVKLYQYLTEMKKEFIMSKQLLRSGTNPGAMVREAENAESSNDFIHKLSIALKETGETLYWLELLHFSGFLSEHEYKSIHSDTTEIGKLLTSSIKTKKRNQIKNIAITIIVIIGFITFFK